MKVRDPDGQTWRVSRRWLPWRRSVRNKDDIGLELPTDVGGDDFGLSLIFFAVVFVLFLVAPIVLVIFFAAFEVVLLLVLMPFAVLGRVVFGRHWHVELRRGWRAWTEIDAGEWRGSAMKIHEIADAVRRGEIPARTIDAPRPA
ncbi:hypothetical protein [Nocardioides cavernaquae]|nr:hypothetical protein [Nocardioides cavernaquae]